VQRVIHIKLGLGEKEYWREKEWREAVGWRLGEVLEEREDGGELQERDMKTESVQETKRIFLCFLLIFF